MTERDDDDLLGQLEAVERDLHAEAVALAAEEVATMARELAAEPERRRRLEAMHAAEERRRATALEGTVTMHEEAAATAYYLTKRKGISPTQRTEVEGHHRPVPLWYMTFNETGVPKDPPSEGGAHPSLSEDRVFEGTEIHVHGIGLGADGKLYRLSGSYDIKGAYNGLYGSEDERDARRRVIARELSPSEISVLLELMPERPEGPDQPWPERVFEAGGTFLFSRVRRPPEETEESYFQRLEEAREKWKLLIVELLQTQLAPTR